MKDKKLVKKKHFWPAEKKLLILAGLMCLFFAIAGSVVSIHRYWQYEASYVDFGIFDQALYKASIFQPPVIDHYALGQILILGDHFSPSLFLLTPLYYIYSDPTVILIAQSFIVGLSGIVLYQLGIFLTKKSFLSLAVLGAYLLFVGLQNAVITDFHDLTLMTLPLMLVFYSIATKRLLLYLLSLAVVLGLKEVTFLLGITLGISIFFLQRSWWKIGIFTIISSAVWGIVTIFFIIPYFSSEYLYSPVLPQTLSGKIFYLFDHELKRSTLFNSFLSFGFLPIFAPQMYLLILQDYTSRFMTEFCCTRWTLGMHYNAQSAVILGVSTLYALKNISRFAIVRKHSIIIAVLILANSLILFRFVLHGPLSLAISPIFLNHRSNFAFLDTLVNKIPKDVSVMTHNNLATRFTRQELYLLRENYDEYEPMYIVIDNRKDQNPNNHFGTTNLHKVIEKLTTDPQYESIFVTEEQMIYKRLK